MQEPKLGKNCVKRCPYHLCIVKPNGGWKHWRWGGASHEGEGRTDVAIIGGGTSLCKLNMQASWETKKQV